MRRNIVLDQKSDALLISLHHLLGNTYSRIVRDALLHYSMLFPQQQQYAKRKTKTPIKA